MTNQEKLLEAKLRYEGLIIDTLYNGLLQIIEYNSSKLVTVKFLETGQITSTSISNIKTGKVKDPSKKSHAGGTKMNLEEVLKLVSVHNPNFELVSEFNGMTKPITIKCTKCEKETLFKTLTGLAYRKVECPECSRLKKELEFISKLLLIRPYIQYISGFIGMKTNAVFKCLICENKFEALPNNLLKPVIKKLGCSKCLLTSGKTNELFIKELNIINPDIEPLSEYRGYFEPITVKCKLCGYEWNGKPDHLLRNTKCPHCQRHKSSGEENVKNVLDSLGIKYEHLHYLLINTSKFFIDFYLEEFNCYIEFNGLLHYKPVSFGERDLDKIIAKFLKQLKRDNFIRSYCLENNIKLLEIKYDEPDVETIIYNFIKDNCGEDTTYIEKVKHIENIIKEKYETKGIIELWMLSKVLKR